MNTRTLSGQIQIRMAGAAKLASDVEPGSVAAQRAAATSAALVALGTSPTLPAVLKARDAAVLARDSAKLYSEAWIAADAAFDVMVALEVDLAPEATAPAEPPAE